MSKKNPNTRYWKCKNNVCQSENDFSIVKILASRDYYTKCNKCNTANVFPRQK